MDNIVGRPGGTCESEFQNEDIARNVVNRDRLIQTNNRSGGVVLTGNEGNDRPCTRGRVALQPGGFEVVTITEDYPVADGELMRVCDHDWAHHVDIPRKPAYLNG